MKMLIYKLFDPRKPEEVCYVGRTSKPTLRIRLIEHLAKSKYRYGRDTKVLNWISSLIEEGITPIIEQIDEIEGWDESHQLERSYINKFIIEGHPIVNLEDTGVNGKNHHVPNELKTRIATTLKQNLTGKVLYNSRKVFVFNKENELIKEFDTASNCARFYNIPIGKIPEICSGKTISKSYNDMTFSYTDKPISPFKNYYVLNIIDNSIQKFTTVRELELSLGIAEGYMSRVINKEKVILKKYKIYDRPVAFVKPDELLEKPVVVNQQPS